MIDYALLVRDGLSTCCQDTSSSLVVAMLCIMILITAFINIFIDIYKFRLFIYFF